MKYRFYVILTYIMCSGLIIGQSEIKFHTLSPKGGLSYDGILAIKQDRKGLMWMLLENNLFCYNGYTYKSYKPFFVNSSDTLNNYINNIATDSHGNLFVSVTSGIYQFNHSKNQFQKKIELPSVGAIHIDNKDTFWINTSIGLGFIGKDESVVYPEFKNRKLALSRNIFCESEKDIFVFSHHGQIFHYNRNDNSFDDFLNLKKEFDGGQIVDAQIRGKELWVLTNKFALFRIDLSTGRVSLQYQRPEINNMNIRCLYAAKDGKVWVGTINGLYIFNPETSSLQLHQHHQDEIFSIPHNSIWTISEDRQNNIWIGTYMGSVAYVNPNDNKIFETFYPSLNGLNKVPVSGFAEEGSSLWISTESGGINILNRQNNQFAYLQQTVSTNSLSSNNTKAPINDYQGNIWISTFRGGLDCYHLSKKHFTHYKHNPEDKESLLFNNLRKIILEPDSGIWIVYLQHTPFISFLSFQDKKFTHFSIDVENSNTMSGDYIYDIYRGKDGMIWLITSHTLYALNTSSKKIAKYEIPLEHAVAASTLCVDADGAIWIGTFGNELLRFEISNNTFRSFSNILQSNIAEIYSINFSEKGIWMGTNDGLYLFNTVTEESVVFKESDGTQGNVYYPLATGKTKDGKLLFGGAGGFTIVSPEKISFNPVSPNAFIADFYIDNESVTGNNTTTVNTAFLSDSSELILNYKQQNFGFEISSDNYLNAEKNQFKYRLRNFDNRWLLTDASNRRIHYAKVPSGIYHFEIRAANNDGVWGPITSVKIIRKRAPWLSIPAIIFYFLLFCFVLYHFIATYKKRKKLEFSLQVDRLEKEKREEIHRNQLQFFTNISHDLKTPLSLIMTTINRMREEGMKEYYYKILNSNSNRLMLMLNDILDFRKIQNKKIKLEISEGNINEFIKTLASDFSEYAVQKQMNYEIILNDEELTSVPFDGKIVEKIVMNLLHNAFKYTPEKGRIKIIVSKHEFISDFSASHTIGDNGKLNSRANIQIVVSDTGVGISEESIAKVFDRFYRVETRNEANHLGTGIGLALVKELVLLHRGSITLYSKRNMGTDIVVRLSSSMDYYQPDEIFSEKQVDFIANSSAIVIPNETFSEKRDAALIHDFQESTVSKDKTILIAEDNKDLRNIIKASLEELFYVIDFDDAQPALEYLKKQDVDLIISDIMMPIVDGITFCNTVKKNIETSHIPFIMLTAKTGLDSMLEGTESGADLYYEKPVDLTLLKASIANIFKQQLALKEYYSKNYFADVSEISTNKEDIVFLKNVAVIIEKQIDQSEMDVNFLASKMMMSRSKLYAKIKTLTGKSIVEFILNYRLRYAAKLLVEKNISIQEAMFSVGIESQSYFTNAFKKEFGLTPSKFVANHKKT